MQGYVLAFRPATREGTIVTDSGETVRFAGANCPTGLQGGDIVTFHTASGGASDGSDGLREIQVVQKGSDRVTATQRPQLRELYAMLELNGLAHYSHS